jgi:NAD(P)-dependent dehydrogenase (short-subunit alcohol dehydrogenase family)
MESIDQTVIVTGAAGNLGQAVVRAFAERGANVVAVDLRADTLTAQFGADDARQLLVAADLMQQNACDGVATQALTRFGRIDVLCNLAGGFRMGTPVHETPDATWNFLFDINVRSLLNMVRAVVPRMLARGEGRIVNVGAYAALKGAAGMGSYCATKCVVVRVTEAMAAELRDRNINVNCVLPTTLDTPANRADMPNADPAKWVAPSDLAQTIVFLASPAARAIHGAALPVTGRS